ncbi:MAG: hypothetical protein SFZ24_08565 [Planctomycetota bacterium]|nr:hypothetical protein [Planctomycetota bacterium]
MSLRTAIGATTALIIGASSIAAADVVDSSVTLTNDTASSWARVVLYIDQAGPLAGPSSRLVRFVDDLSLQSSDGGLSDRFFVDGPARRILAFDFSQHTMLAPGATYTFNVRIDDPQNAGFSLGYRIIEGEPPPAPAPAAAGLLALAGLTAARRRR